MSSPEPGDPDGDRVPACFIACPPDGGTCRPRRVTPATRPPPAGRRPRCPEPSPGWRTRSAELDLCPSGAVPLFPCVHRRRTSQARGIPLFKSPAPSPDPGQPYPARLKGRHIPQGISVGDATNPGSVSGVGSAPDPCRSPCSTSRQEATFFTSMREGRAPKQGHGPDLQIRKPARARPRPSHTAAPGSSRRCERSASAIGAAATTHTATAAEPTVRPTASPSIPATSGAAALAAVVTV